MDIGIDLGTTFSVMAVKGRVQLAEGYPEGMYLEECDVTIIPTPFGEFTVPSVFWASPDNPSEVLVGSEAKHKAQEGESPVMFSKRSIGTDEPLRLHDRTYTAKEVATHILKYLKDCAERALGQPVQRAVVTHPAYFDRNQVEETREAAVAAGFDMALPEQLMMEPAAAALAFIQGDERDPLRVLIYDLGGSTFNVSVLERCNGVITVRAFDGDLFLGGDDFDRSLLHWITSRLQNAGRIARTGFYEGHYVQDHYQFDFDPLQGAPPRGPVLAYDTEFPPDRARRGRLMQLAEATKIRLNEQRSNRIPVRIRARDLLVDSDGREIPIEEKINREQFAELIKEYLDKTIACCQRAIAKAGMGVDEIDAVILVGGSTYGQWVQEAVRKSLGHEPILYNADLVIAAGAALHAAHMYLGDHGESIRLFLDVASTSVLPSIDVLGCVRVGDGSDLEYGDRRNLKVVLTTPHDGVLGPSELGSKGVFVFKDVWLLEGEPTQFTLKVIDGSGLDQLIKTFTVDYRPDATDIPEISTYLPMPLYLGTAAGLQRIAEEGTALPFRSELTLTRLHSDASLRIPIYQEDQEAGQLYVDDIPPEGGEGNQVVVTLEISQRSEIHGSIRVMQRAGEIVVAERPVHIYIPPLILPDLTMLRSRFESLEARREELLALSLDPEQRLVLAGKGAKLSRRGCKLFAEQVPDKEEIYRLLKDLDRLVNPPPDDMDPPRAHFLRLVQECRDLLSDQRTNPELNPLRTALARLEYDGSDAFRTKNHRRWAIAHEGLVYLHDRVIKATGTGTVASPPELPPPLVLKDYFKQEVVQLYAVLDAQRKELEVRSDFATRLKPRCDAVAQAIRQLEATVDEVKDDLEPRRALAQLQVARRAVHPIQERIRNVPHDV